MITLISMCVYCVTMPCDIKSESRSLKITDLVFELKLGNTYLITNIKIGHQFDQFDKGSH